MQGGLAMEHTMGRVTIPTDMDVVKETLELAKKWGADAVRDCDGTDFPKELKDAGLKVYATYYTTRKDNAWAKDFKESIGACFCGVLLADVHGGGGRASDPSDERALSRYARAKQPG